MSDMLDDLDDPTIDPLVVQCKHVFLWSSVRLQSSMAFFLHDPSRAIVTFAGDPIPLKQAADRAHHRGWPRAR